MDRGSDRHGPVQDAELSKETQDVVHGTGSSRAEDWRDPEPSGEDQPRANRDPEGSRVGGTPEGIDADDAAARSEFAQSITRLRFPTTGAEVQAAADQDTVPDAVRAEVRRLPADGRYESLAEVWAALGHGMEDRRG